VAGWIPANIYYPLISSFHGMAASGQLKALMNLTLPLEQVKAALSMLFLPYAARVAARRGATGPTALTTQMTLLAFAGAVVYWAFILPFPKQVFQLMYSGKYQDVVGLLPIVAIGSIVWSAAYGPAIALRGMEAPDLVFKAFAVATVGSLIIGVPATWFFGLRGAIWGGNLADFSSLIMVFVVLKRRLRQRAAQAITSETLVTRDRQPS
jgi:O-antigen/teichoic acid export membrane protein